MATCEAQLYGIIASHIEPTTTQKAGACRSQNALREALYTGNLEARLGGTYLTGSYARDTAVQPLDDVDIVVLIDPSHWVTPFLCSYPDPEAVLATFARAIRLRYPESSVCTQRRSVGLKLYHLDIDVVPAIDVGNDFIKIPDRHAGKWITSAPNRHTTIASELNARRNRKFKPLVKLIKAWNQRLPATARLKSFTVETIATRLFHQESFNTLEQGLMKFFDFLAHHTDTETIFDWKQDYGMSFDEIWGIEIPDTAGTGNNVAANIDWTKAQKFLMHGIHTRNKLERADESAYEETAFRHFCKALKIV